jgi:TrmH family RNA methyltransferase
MLSKNAQKLIKSLQQKKYRIKNNLFLVEGVKGVNEFLSSDFSLEKMYCTNEFKYTVPLDKVELITEDDLKKISNLHSPNRVIALFEMPEQRQLKNEVFSLVLDGVNDPGNLGTIIRLCDWFGIPQLICSKDTVDCFNSKVVQSTMGSLTRVSIVYADLEPFLSNSTLPIYAANMNGSSVYDIKFPHKAILVMGNEANGISRAIEKLITNKVTIPRFGAQKKAESLNVATAAAILLSEFKRS